MPPPVASIAKVKKRQEEMLSSYSSSHHSRGRSRNNNDYENDDAGYYYPSTPTSPKRKLRTSSPGNRKMKSPGNRTMKLNYPHSAPARTGGGGGRGSKSPIRNRTTIHDMKGGISPPPFIGLSSSSQHSPKRSPVVPGRRKPRVITVSSSSPPPLTTLSDHGGSRGGGGGSNHSRGSSSVGSSPRRTRYPTTNTSPNYLEPIGEKKNNKKKTTTATKKRKKKMKASSLSPKPSSRGKKVPSKASQGSTTPSPASAPTPKVRKAIPERSLPPIPDLQDSTNHTRSSPIPFKKRPSRIEREQQQQEATTYTSPLFKQTPTKKKQQLSPSSSPKRSPKSPKREFVNSSTGIPPPPPLFGEASSSSSSTPTTSRKQSPKTSKKKKRQRVVLTPPTSPRRNDGSNNDRSPKSKKTNHNHMDTSSLHNSSSIHNTSSHRNNNRNHNHNKPLSSQSTLPPMQKAVTADGKTVLIQQIPVSSREEADRLNNQSPDARAAMMKDMKKNGWMGKSLKSLRKIKIEEHPPRSLVIIWLLMAAELGFDLATTWIAFANFLGGEECCGQEIELGRLPLLSTIPFLLLVCAEMLFLSRAITLTLWPSLQHNPDEDELAHASSIKRCFNNCVCCLKWNARMALRSVNVLTVINPFLSALVAWVLMYEGDRTEALVVLGLEAASIVMHGISVYFEGDYKTKGKILFHSLPLIPFIIIVSLCLVYLKQGGVCYLADKGLFLFSGCEVCDDNMPPIDGMCGNETIIGGGKNLFGSLLDAEDFSDFTSRSYQSTFCAEPDDPVQTNFCFYDY